MEVEFTEMFYAASSGWVSEDDVVSAVRQPEATRVLQHDGAKAGFATKWFSRAGFSARLLVCCQIDGSKYQVQSAYWIRGDLVANVMEPDPFLLLQQLVDRFGLPIKVGSMYGKFIYHEIAEQPFAEGETLVFEVANPLDHNICVSLRFKPIVGSDGLGKVDCWLVYCIDVTAYESELLGSQMVDGCVFFHFADAAGETET